MTVNTSMTMAAASATSTILANPQLFHGHQRQSSNPPLPKHFKMLVLSRNILHPPPSHLSSTPGILLLLVYWLVLVTRCWTPVTTTIWYEPQGCCLVQSFAGVHPLCWQSQRPQQVINTSSRLHEESLPFQMIRVARLWDSRCTVRTIGWYQRERPFVSRKIVLTGAKVSTNLLEDYTSLVTWYSPLFGSKKRSVWLSMQSILQTDEPISMQNSVLADGGWRWASWAYYILWLINKYFLAEHWTWMHTDELFFVEYWEHLHRTCEHCWGVYCLTGPATM